MSTPAAWVPELRSVLPDDAVVDDPDVISGYSRNMAMLAANGRPARVHAAIKAALDPLGIMKPGKIFASGSSIESTPELVAVGR